MGKKSKLLSPGKHRQNTYITVNLPVARARIICRPLPPAEIAAILSSVRELTDGETPLEQINPRSNPAMIGVFYEQARRLAVAASVKPQLTAEPTDDPGKLHVRELDEQDVAAILGTVLTSMGASIEQLSELAGTPDYMGELPLLSPRVDPEAQRNAALSNKILGLVPHLTGQEPRA